VRSRILLRNLSRNNEGLGVECSVLTGVDNSDVHVQERGGEEQDPVEEPQQEQRRAGGGVLCI
jgi:hypothetical protein